jgi:hypothetical protein
MFRYDRGHDHDVRFQRDGYDLAKFAQALESNLLREPDHGDASIIVTAQLTPAVLSGVQTI